MDVAQLTARVAVRRHRLPTACFAATVNHRRAGDRMPLPWVRLAISVVAGAFVATACSGSAATPSRAAGATSRPSISLAPVADPSSKPSPALLPGGRLVYDQWIGDVGRILTSNPDGTDITPLLQTGTGEQPRWSPDGRHISIVAENGDGLVFVGLIDPDGSHYVQFDSPDPTLNLGCFAWSPDGSTLACEGWEDTHPSRNGIYTVRSSDGGHLARVTTSPDGAHDSPNGYSPDGHTIVFARGKPGDDAHSTLMVVNVNDRRTRALSDQNLGGGRWSPDGKTILSGAGAEAEQLLLVPIDGGAIRTIQILSDNRPKTAFFASWSPDGEWIVFSGRTTNDVDLFIVRVDGTDLHQVTDTPGKYEDSADWTAAAP